MKRPLAASFCLSLNLGAGMPAACADISQQGDVQNFIQEFSVRHPQHSAELAQLFKQVEIQQKIIDSMNRPAEAKPWAEYRKIILSEARIANGVKFWKSYQAYLDEAAARYGVAPEMIVAILGTESRYGEVMGNYRVLDALATLSFAYPRRAAYFRKELEEYLVLCAEAGFNPLQPKGSYAGAMGMVQFMPSSFRQTAVDGDGDQRRNLWSNPADAIASVAHYFAKAGWKTGEPVALQPSIIPTTPQLASPAGKLDRSLDDLRKQGYSFDSPLPGNTKAGLLILDQPTGPEHWLLLHNFQVITRYNHSQQYAMAAHQLGLAITARKSGQAH